MAENLTDAKAVRVCERIARKLNSSVASAYLIVSETRNIHEKMTEEEVLERVEKAAEEFAKKTWEA